MTDNASLCHGDGGPRTGRPPPEGANVACARDATCRCFTLISLLLCEASTRAVLQRALRHCFWAAPSNSLGVAKRVMAPGFSLRANERKTR